LRYFIYVNTTRLTITVHCEKANSCGEIMKKLVTRNSQSKIIGVGNTKSIIKMGITSNGF